jgi:hypothetical protein
MNQCYHAEDYGRTDSLYNVVETWLEEPKEQKELKKPQKSLPKESIKKETEYDYYVHEQDGSWVEKELQPQKKKKPIQIDTESTEDLKPVSWVIFARGVSKKDIKKRFPNLEQNYEICRFDRKLVKLECASASYKEKNEKKGLK